MTTRNRVIRRWSCLKLIPLSLRKRLHSFPLRSIEKDYQDCWRSTREKEDWYAKAELATVAGGERWMGTPPAVAAVNVAWGERKQIFPRRSPEWKERSATVRRQVDGSEGRESEGGAANDRTQFSSCLIYSALGFNLVGFLGSIYCYDS